ncbi:MAG: hypothetical protein KGL46_04120 [Hyphomicrobiales bacterium]|nr:hypothetical protein [Hyphomicrobiales bacterium]
MQQSHNAQDVLDAAMVLLGSLLQALRDKKIFTDQEMTAIFHRAANDASSNPNHAQIVAVMHAMLKAKP